jgi:hypothetical protein
MDAYVEDYKKNHPNATDEEIERFRDRTFEGVAGFKNAQGSKWVYKNAKVGGVPRMVRYDEKDRGATMQFADGTPMTEEQAGSVVFDAGKTPPGMKFDKDTGQVWDRATGKRYNANDPNNPPEVQAMFTGHDAAIAATQAYGLRLTKERGESYNNSKLVDVLDAQDGNRPTKVRADEFRASPGRYMPATAGAAALRQVNMFEDIGRTSRATRDAISALPEGEAFDEAMRAKIAVALKADDHGGAFDALMSSNLLGSLTKEQVNFLVASRQLSENAMAIRSILGAGQGSIDVRRAIERTLPSLLSPDREFAVSQLDAFDKTLEQLHRGVPNVPLSQVPWTVKDGGPGDRQPPNEGGAAPSGTGAKLKGGRSVSQVRTWMQQQQQWKGQTVTDDMARKYITDNGYAPTP